MAKRNSTVHAAGRIIFRTGRSFCRSTLKCRAHMAWPYKTQNAPKRSVSAKKAAIFSTLSAISQAVHVHERTHHRRLRVQRHVFEAKVYALSHSSLGVLYCGDVDLQRDLSSDPDPDGSLIDERASFTRGSVIATLRDSSPISIPRG